MFKLKHKNTNRLRLVFLLHFLATVSIFFGFQFNVVSAQTPHEQCVSFLDAGQQDAYNTCVEQVTNQGGDLGGQDSVPGTNSTQPNYVPNDCNGPNIQAGQSEGSENHCGILNYLVLFINVLSALAGVVIAASIAYGGIQYSMAGSDPQKISTAKSRIRNALIALLFFIFGFGFLNYLVPGGLL